MTAPRQIQEWRPARPARPNNAVLVPRGQAAAGSFSFWIPFFGAILAAGGAVLGAVLGLARSR